MKNPGRWNNNVTKIVLHIPFLMSHKTGSYCLTKRGKRLWKNCDPVGGDGREQLVLPQTVAGKLVGSTVSFIFHHCESSKYFASTEVPCDTDSWSFSLRSRREKGAVSPEEYRCIQAHALQQSRSWLVCVFCFYSAGFALNIFQHMPCWARDPKIEEALLTAGLWIRAFKMDFLATTRVHVQLGFLGEPGGGRQSTVSCSGCQVQSTYGHIP